MSVSHPRTWIQVIYCDLFKYFHCPTTVREFFFSKFSLSGNLPTSVTLLEEEVCSAVQLCPVNHY